MESAWSQMCGSRRQKVSMLNVVCLGISAIALVLQTVSVATDHWADAGDRRFHVNAGLWKMCSCVYGSCTCYVISSSDQVKLFHVALVCAIPAILLTAILDFIELFYEKKEGWRVGKFVSAAVSAICLYVGVGDYVINYEEALADADGVIPVKISIGWSFILCIVASTAMTIVSICYIVDICRKRRSGPGISIQSSGDTTAIVPHDALALEAGSVPPVYPREIPTGKVAYYAGTQ